MKVLIFLFFIFINFVSYADSYAHFNFKPSNRLVLNNVNSINVEFFYNIVGEQEKNFYVVPVCDSCLVSIFNANKGEWVFSSQNLNQMPTLSRSHVIKIQNMGKDTADVKFKIIHIKTGKSWETPVKVFWSEKVFGDYISRLNSNFGKMH